MKEYIRKVFIFGVIVAPIFFVSFFLSLTNTITTSYRGFSLDNNGSLYVGESYGIGVYENGEFVKIVYETGMSGWAFAIQDEKLYVSSGTRVEVMDLSGTLIEIVDYSDMELLYKFFNQRNAFVADDEIYVATNKLGYYKITKYSNGESETVFQMPILDYVFGCAGNIIPIICVVLFFTGYFKWLIIKFGRK